VAKHLRRRRRGSRERPTVIPDNGSRDGDPFAPSNTFFDAGPADTPPLDSGAFDDAFQPERVDSGWADGDRAPDEDWFQPPQPGDEAYAAHSDVSLASMLMLGTSSYQRIDGMGLARKALEAVPTGDTRRDLSKEERSMLANARAWCLLVHGDLGHRSRLDDPFVLADAERHVEVAGDISPQDPCVETTLALLRLRQGRLAEAAEGIKGAMEAFAQMPDHDRTGRTQATAIMATLTQAIVAASSGDAQGAKLLSTVARGVRTPLDIDEASFAALTGQIDRSIEGDA
jgi:hypothetical protein